MEEPEVRVNSEDTIATKDSRIQEHCVSTNWRVTQDNKHLSDVITTVAKSKAPASLTLDDIVTVDSGIILQPPNANIDNEHEICHVEINLTEGRRISRIGIVSEGSVIEFFKESGEYAGTEFAELLDEFEDTTVYCAELFFKRPTPQATVKFTRIHNSRSDMYLYGIKLVLEDEKNSSSNEKRMYESIIKNSFGDNLMPGKIGQIPDFANSLDYDGNLSSDMNACLMSIMGKLWEPHDDRKLKKKVSSASVGERERKKVISEKAEVSQSNLESYMDEKIREMENRLMKRIDEVEANTMKKLDSIIKHLESRS